jgi:activator of HSP90 ATPase
MAPTLLSRRAFNSCLTALAWRLGVAETAFGAAGESPADTAKPAAPDGLSHTAEAIHQEVVFQASRARVYETLTDARRFDAVVRLSAAMQSGMVQAGSPTEISPNVGGTFSLFGGYLTGRHVELVPGLRIVQVWRAASWNPGEHSIVRFELMDQGAATKVVLDHRGFPQGTGAHLAEGWHLNYWQPLEKYLAQESH